MGPGGRHGWVAGWLDGLGTTAGFRGMRIAIAKIPGVRAGEVQDSARYLILFILQLGAVVGIKDFESGLR